MTSKLIEYHVTHTVIFCSLSTELLKALGRVKANTAKTSTILYMFKCVWTMNKKVSKVFQNNS